MIAAATVLFAACSDSDTFREVINDNETVLIGFETYHEKVTRATVTDTLHAPQNFTKEHGGFGVWGIKGAPSDMAAASGTPAIVNLSNAEKYTKVFDNVQVWYDADSSASATQKHAHFTYAIPKYWDKTTEYHFFAYAPYDASNAKFDATKGIIKIEDITPVQDVSTSNNGTGAALVFNGSTTSGITDYLMATYAPNQKYLANGTGTNQKDSTYRDHGQTVGFVFGHMLSKLRVNVSANETYRGIKEMKITYLAIENMPEKSASSNAIFTQKSPTAAAGDYTPSYYSTILQVINSDDNNNTKATAKDSIFVLKNGTISQGVAQQPTDQPQSFNYYVVPNKPADNSTTANKKYYLSVKYTIKYVDGISEDVVPDKIDLSSKLASLDQNNSYILNVKIALNEILFTVASVEEWATDTELDQLVTED